MISLHKTVHVREFPEKQNCAWTPLCGCGDFPKWRVALSAWWPLFLLIVPSLSLKHFSPCMSGNRPKKSAASVMRDILPIHPVCISTKMSHLPPIFLSYAHGCANDFPRSSCESPPTPSIWHRVIFIYKVLFLL